MQSDRRLMLLHSIESQQLGQRRCLALMAASISSADLPDAQMMKMWPNLASYFAFICASSCANAYVRCLECCACTVEQCIGCTHASHGPHLKHVRAGAASAGLLGATEICECAVLLPEALQIAYAGVHGKGLQPSCDWELRDKAGHT